MVAPPALDALAKKRDRRTNKSKRWDADATDLKKHTAFAQDACKWYVRTCEKKKCRLNFTEKYHF